MYPYPSTLEYPPRPTVTGLDTVEQALAALENAVGDRGDFVYMSRHGKGAGVCTYVKEGRPDCLIGHVLVAAGVPVEWFEQPCALTGAGSTPASRNTRSAGGICFELGIDHRVAVVLGHAQTAQDGGLPWGSALERARFAATATA